MSIQLLTVLIDYLIGYMIEKNYFLLNMTNRIQRKYMKSRILY